MEVLAALAPADAALLLDLAEVWLTCDFRFVMAQVPYDLIKRLAQGGHGASRIARDPRAVPGVRPGGPARVTGPLHLDTHDRKSPLFLSEGGVTRKWVLLAATPRHAWIRSDILRVRGQLGLRPEGRLPCFIAAIIEVLGLSLLHHARSGNDGTSYVVSNMHIQAFKDCATPTQTNPTK